MIHIIPLKDKNNSGSGGIQLYVANATRPWNGGDPVAQMKNHRRGSGFVESGGALAMQQMMNQQKPVPQQQQNNATNLHGRGGAAGARNTNTNAAAGGRAYINQYNQHQQQGQEVASSGGGAPPRFGSSGGGKDRDHTTNIHPRDMIQPQGPGGIAPIRGVASGSPLREKQQMML